MHHVLRESEVLVGLEFVEKPETIKFRLIWEPFEKSGEEEFSIAFYRDKETSDVKYRLVFSRLGTEQTIDPKHTGGNVSATLVETGVVDIEFLAAQGMGSFILEWGHSDENIEILVDLAIYNDE